MNPRTARNARRRTPAPLAVALAGALAVVLVAATTACLPGPAVGPVVGRTAPPAPTTAPPASWTATGRGWGHGVGLSQWGARNHAAAGRDARWILAHYYRGTAVVAVPEAGGHRVQVAPAAPAFTLTADRALTVTRDGGVPLGTAGPGATVTVTRSGAGVAVTGAVVGTGGSLRVEFDGPVRVAPAGHRYQYGTLTVAPDGTAKLLVRNEGLTMAQLLYGLGEVPSLWPAEALKAQAVAARTFAQKRRAAGGDLRAWTDMSYVGHDKVTAGSFDRWRAAVDATAGQVVTHSGGLVDALFSASNGGRTASSAQVWGGARPYLVAADDPVDAAAPNPWGTWRRTWTSGQLGGLVGVGTLVRVDVAGADDVHQDRARFTFTGTAGARTLTGAQLRSTVNAGGGSLPSTWFTLVPAA